MALARFFLLTFLPVHLYVNLMLFKSNPQPFNNAPISWQPLRW